MDNRWPGRDRVSQQEPGEDWKARAERLEECVCVLLLKNQMLRIALQTGQPPNPARKLSLDASASWTRP